MSLVKTRKTRPKKKLSLTDRLNPKSRRLSVNDTAELQRNSGKGTGNREQRKMGDHTVWKGRRFHVQTHSRSHTQVLDLDWTAAGHDESSVDSTFMLWHL